MTTSLDKTRNISFSIYDLSANVMLDFKGGKYRFTWRPSKAQCLHTCAMCVQPVAHPTSENVFYSIELGSCLKFCWLGRSELPGFDVGRIGPICQFPLVRRAVIDGPLMAVWVTVLFRSSPLSTPLRKMNNSCQLGNSIPGKKREK